MSDETQTEGLLADDQIYSYTNLSNHTGPFHKVCTFNEVNSISEFFYLFGDNYCRRYSIGFTAFLCVANFLILLFGFFGNSMVIYVVTRKITKKTASSWFILNLAVADLLVILCCIPTTLVANIFRPWILGDTMCKVAAYAQGVSVFCSVYSLVAISFDRCRAIHQPIGLFPSISTSLTYKIILLIWLIGITITLPWAFVFKRMYLPTGDSTGTSDSYLPFCYEAWNTKFQEVIYFLVIHVSACFLLPLGLIVVCNVAIWKEVLGVRENSSTSSSTSPCVPMVTSMHRDRKLRVLKMFTLLTFVFFICWIPLYLIMARVKFFYDESFSGSQWEKKLIVILIPLAQLLGSCNSCVNPVLYAMLNQTFHESFKSILGCPLFCNSPSPSISLVSKDNNSIIAVRVTRLEIRDTPA